MIATEGLYLLIIVGNGTNIQKTPRVWALHQGVRCDGQWRADWNVQLLWWRWDNVPYPVLETEHIPPDTNPVGDELAEQLWRNPPDKFPR